MVGWLGAVVSPYQFWRDVFLKHHPELAGRIHDHLKRHYPNLALKVALPSSVKKGSVKGYIGRIVHCIQVGDFKQAEALAKEGVVRFRPMDAMGLTEDYRKLCGHYAKIAELQTDWPTAVVRWRDLLALEKTHPHAASYRCLLHALLEAGDVEAAEATVREGIALFPPTQAMHDEWNILDHPILAKERVPDFFLSVPMLRRVHQEFGAKGVRLIILMHPNLRDMENLSPHERSILQGKASVEERIRANHADIAHCDEAYVRALSSPIRVVQRDGVLLNEDVRSQYVNIVDGVRWTIGQPEHYNQTIYCVGSSRYCTHSEDRYTISSCLQRLFNQSGLAVRVVNPSTVAARLHHQVTKIRRLAVKSGDTVVLEFQHDRKTRANLKAVASSLGIPWHDFTDDFRMDRRVGEIFVDRQHLNYRGNEEIAQRLYDRFFSAYPLLQSRGCAWAEKMLQAVDQGRFPDGAAAQTDPMQAQIDTAYADVPVFHDGTVGAIVMNCNPITRGHMHLITLASQIVKHLYVFVVEEDRSAFSFADRLEMIRRATASLPHVVVVPSGRFILSVETFPEYFEKDMKQEAIIDTSQDIGIFGRYIARRFGITLRFVGEEPTDKVTRQYNAEMKASLPQYGVQVLEIPRLESGDEAISASRVRALLREQQWDAVAAICPSTTVDYLREMVQQGRLTV